jgi:hypothetical protein
MKRAASLLILAAPALGCAATLPPRAPTPEVLIGYLTPHRGQQAGDTYKVTTNGLLSPKVQISRTEDGFRGTVRRKLIELHVADDEVVGALDGQPIRLRIEHEGDKLFVHGLYSGALVSYRLARGHGERVAPGQPAITTELAAPAEPGEALAIHGVMAKLGEGEAVALLSVMLFTGVDRQVGPPARPTSVGHSTAQSPAQSGAGKKVAHSHTGRERG